MYLDRVVINNFRSIKKATIRFDHHCRILLGKNEAGKSNVLKAIAALFGLYSVSSRDKRKKINNEKIDSYTLYAVIRFSDDEIKQIVDIFLKDNNVSFVDKDIFDFAKAVLKEFLIWIDVEDKAKPYCSYWSFTDKSFIVETSSSLSIKEATEKMFNAAEIYYKKNPFVCHLWKYNDNYLLPSSVNINEFVTNPSICPGLRNLFVLSDRSDIKKEFEEAIAQDTDYYNLFDQVSTTVTTTFRTIWPDFKDTSIQLSPNGSEIAIKVSNKAKYSFDDRSDGFKHFISILLMLSAPSKKGQIGERDIIIIDEPDTSLYPSSARYLRDELLRMGQSSYIVYATHSQYMIDSKCIDRHLIVEKRDDITTVSSPNENAEYSEDELLLNAIGTSIFECIRSKNLIFEGWLDKKLFEMYVSSDKSLSKKYKEFGSVYLHGISGVAALSQLLMLAQKEFIIVADSDTTSINKKKDFISNYPEYKSNWRDYGSVVKGITTLEDFLTPEYVETCIKDKCDSKFVFDKTKTVIDNITSLVGNEKESKQSIKNLLIEGADKTSVKKEYRDYISSLLV